MIKSISRLFLLFFVFTELCLVLLPTVGFSQTEDVIIEFTLDFEDNPNRKLVITIKNNLGASYYNIRFKKHNETEWNYYPIDPTSVTGYNTYDAYNNSVPYEASNSDYTLVTLFSYTFQNLPVGSKVDVQIQALIGDYKEVVYGFSAPLPTYDYYFEGTITDWSNTQTIESLLDGVSVPSVPEFSVRFVSYPYGVPEKTVTTVDQYTGKETVTTTPGYRVENKSIEIVVKNQPFTYFTPYTDEDGHEINLFYDVQVKGHYGDDWETVGRIDSGGIQSNAQLDSEFTIISIDPEEYPGDAVLDFRVQALIGYYHSVGPNLVFWVWEFEGQKSGWSQIQTYSLAETTFEVIPEFPSWISLPLFLVVTSLVVFVRKQKAFGDSAL